MRQPMIDLPRTTEGTSHDVTLDSSWTGVRESRKPLGRARARSEISHRKVFRSTSSRDRVFESSVTAKPLNADVSKMSEASDAQDVTDFEEQEPIRIEDTPDRLDRIISVLCRRETLNLMERFLLPSRALRLEPSTSLEAFLLASRENLDTFASLVFDGAVTVTDGQLRLTALAERLIGELVEQVRDDT
jgi:hypothetical protein